MTTTPQAALLSEADMLDCLREATHEIPTRIPPGWRKVMQATEKRILAKLQATQELAQAGSASLLDGCKSIMDSIAVSSSVIEHNKQEPAQAGELPPPPTLSDDERQWLHYNPNTSDIEEWVYGYAVAYARAALSARKPLTLTEIDGFAKVYAKTYSSPHHFTIDCEGIRKIINGIGLEVKP